MNEWHLNFRVLYTLTCLLKVISRKETKMSGNRRTNIISVMNWNILQTSQNRCWFWFITKYYVCATLPVHPPFWHFLCKCVMGNIHNLIVYNQRFIWFILCVIEHGKLCGLYEQKTVSCFVM